MKKGLDFAIKIFQLIILIKKFSELKIADTGFETKKIYKYKIARIVIKRW